MGVTNDKDAQANDRNASPAKEIYLFIEKQESENGNHEIGKSGGGLNVTIVCPSEHEHVGDEKRKQAGNSEPNVTGGKNADQNMKKFLRLPLARGADCFHSLAEQHIAERGE